MNFLKNIIDRYKEKLGVIHQPDELYLQFGVPYPLFHDFLILSGYTCFIEQEDQFAHYKNGEFEVFDHLRNNSLIFKGSIGFSNDIRIGSYSRGNLIIYKEEMFRRFASSLAK